MVKIETIDGFHDDDRRTLVPIYNGDFLARTVTALFNGVFFSPNKTDVMYAPLERDVVIQTSSGDEIVMSVGQRALVPGGLEHVLVVPANGVALKCSVANDAGTKSLGFDDSSLGIAQVKVLKMKKDAELGGHSHSYHEGFMLLQGDGWFELQDGSTCDLTKKNLIVKPYTAHRAFLTAGSTMVGITEKPYVSPALNDIPYSFGTPMDKNRL